MAEPLHLHGIRIDKAGQTLITVDTTVAPGEVLTVMGPSGAGKSTLLAFITGTLAPAFSAKGKVLIGAQEVTDLPPEARRIGILFQDDMLFPHLSVGDNLAFGLPAAIRGRATRRTRIAEALAEIGLDGYAERDPATLSGGQKARVALMRMLLSEPRALLLDEPFSRLDATLRAQIRSLVFERARAQGLPVVMVTHDAEDAAAANGPIIEIGAAPSPSSS